MQTASLQRRINLLGLSVLLGVGALAYVGYSSIDKLMQLAQLDNVNNMTHASMDLDMMHDAINNDVLVGLQEMASGNSAKILKMQKAHARHVKRAEGNLETMVSSSLPKDIKDQTEDAAQEFKAYNMLATQSLDAALMDNSRDQFAKQFDVLEEKLGALGETLVAWSQQIKSNGESHAAEAKKLLLITLTISIFLALLTPIYIALRLFKPLGELLQSCDQLSAEEYGEAIPHQNRKDEIGRFAHSLEMLRGKAAEAFRLKQMVEDLPISIIAADAENDFKITYANKKSLSVLGSLQRHMPVSMDKLIGTSIDIFHKDPQRIRNILKDPKNLPHNAKVPFGGEIIQQQVTALYDQNGKYLGPVLAWELITGKEKLADSFEHSVGGVVTKLVDASSDLQERAVTLQGAIEELSITAADISSQASESLEIVRESSSKGEEARSFMTQLSTAAEQITSVVTLISSIAEKTNLLALNATIESARAGEAGKGFSVVASEVKTLANQTADAISGIATRISEIQNASSNAFRSVKEICDSVAQIDKVASSIAGTIEQQRAATTEIARHISGAGGNRIGAEQGSVMTYAAQLKEVSGHLQQECGAFLESVRKI